MTFTIDYFPYNGQLIRLSLVSGPVRAWPGPVLCRPPPARARQVETLHADQHSRHVRTAAGGLGRRENG